MNPTSEKCSFCGSPLTAGKRICDYCGAPIDEGLVTEMPIAAPPPIVDEGIPSEPLPPIPDEVVEPETFSPPPASFPAASPTFSASQSEKRTGRNWLWVGGVVLAVVIICMCLGVIGILALFR